LPWHQRRAPLRERTPRMRMGRHAEGSGRLPESFGVGRETYQGRHREGGRRRGNRFATTHIFTSLDRYPSEVPVSARFADVELLH
jgi:hypothetical protein